MFGLNFRKLSRLPIAWFGIAIIFAFWGGIWFQVQSDFNAAEESAHKDLKNFSRVFDEHIARTVRELDKALILARKSYLDARGTMSYQEAIGQRLPDPELLSDISFQMATIDRDGILRATTIGTHPPKLIDLKDREHFLVHKTRRNDTPYISKPVLGRRSGRWSVQLTRAIHGPDGSFDGVLVASIDPAYFGSFYRAINLGSNGIVLFAGFDGLVRVATGAGSLRLGDNILETDLLSNARNGSGIYHGDMDGSGKERIYAIRRIADHPLFVAVGISRNEIFAAAENNLVRYVMAGAVLTIILLAAIIAIVRHHLTILRMARYDDLTGLANRAHFRKQLEIVVADTSKAKNFILLLVDVDNFKSANDTFGHLFGDRILCELGQRMQGCVRKNDLVARLGGDEFAIIFRGVEEGLDVEGKAQQFLDALGKPIIINNQRITVTSSIGSVISNDRKASTEELFRNADLALYKAKTDGRNCHRAFHPDMAHGFAEKRRLEEDLREALDKEQLHLHYQALISLKENRVCGFEALLRWDHPEKGAISPVVFIPIAEETGLILTIGEWVLNKACHVAASFENDKGIAVNLSPVQFRDADLVKKIKNALQSSGLAPERLELEITESLMMEASEEIVDMITEIRRLGVRIVMDDFGIGYSSLSYLCNFEFDKIKIDRSFVKGLEENTKYIAIIRSILSLADSLGADTTAEGIETMTQLETLRAMGCTEAQGFLLSYPKPIEELDELINFPENRQTGDISLGIISA